MKGKRLMKRILLTLATAAVLSVGSAALLAGGAGAANPHGDKSQPNGSDASCGGNGGGGNPGGTCNDPGLTQSEGCQHGQAPVQNPHCTVQATGITPTAPTTTTPPAAAPTPQAGQGQAGQNAQGVAGKEAAGGTAGRAATAANPAQTIDQLPFTGLETLWLALAGAGMLALGLVLRVRSTGPAEAADPARSPDSGGEPVRPRLRDPGMVTVPDLGIATFEMLGLPLIGVRQARGRAGPGDASARLRAGPGDTFVAPLGAT
jgi:hypothetical protein